MKAYFERSEPVSEWLADRRLDQAVVKACCQGSGSDVVQPRPVREIRLVVSQRGSSRPYRRTWLPPLSGKQMSDKQMSGMEKSVLTNPAANR